MDDNTTKIIKKETIHRLLTDVKQIIKYPLIDNGIYYSHDDSDMLKGYAMIIGQHGTPYFSGFYFFKFLFPYDYPYSPPIVKYMTNDGFTRYNPNLYIDGKVCVSILNTWVGDKWSSCQTINSILLTLCSLLNDHPLLNEPGINKQDSDFIPYQKSIQFSNINFSICTMINLFNQKIPPPFEIFYSFMRENFLKNYDKLIEIVDSHNQDEPGYQIVDIYKMSTYINYQDLKEKLIATKQIVETI
jgi:ubiquitin-protein ligase